MVNLAANISLMFNELPFLDRFDAAADAGFRAVEFMFPYAFPADLIAQRIENTGLEVALFNLPAGDWDSGERGIGALPERIGECRAGVARALEYAGALGCRKLHLMAGVAPRDPEHRETLIGNLRYAADLVSDEGIEILVEPINTKIDVPGYFYSGTEDAVAVLEEADRPNLRLQYDVYHMQIMEGDLARSIERLLHLIGHIQIADNPGRNEPGSGEINFPWLLDRIDALGYEGWVGCEYRPAAETLPGLGWATPYLANSSDTAQ